MFETVKVINSTTTLVSEKGRLFVAKVILPDDFELYKTIAGISAATPFLATIQSIQNMNGRLCAVREYIDGTPLEEYTEVRGGLSDDEAKKIVCDVCRGLEKLHAYGIVHRDITPANIIIDRLGNAVIIDFGISRLTKPSQGADTQILGTQGYAAPEQFGFKQTGVRADIYSVGVLLNYMKTLKMPNEQHALGYIGKVVAKCTKIDEKDRYRSVREVAYALEHPRRSFTFYSEIPGFRSGVLWHKAVAVAYYLLAFIGVSLMLEDGKMTFAQFLFVILDMIAPVLIITDFYDWSKRNKFTAKLSNGKRAVVRVVLALLVMLPMDLYYWLGALMDMMD